VVHRIEMAGRLRVAICVGSVYAKRARPEPIVLIGVGDEPASTTRPGRSIWQRYLGGIAWERGYRPRLAKPPYSSAKTSRASTTSVAPEISSTHSTPVSPSVAATITPMQVLMRTMPSNIVTV